MDIAQHILFEDNHLLVLDKPAGLLTQDAPTGGDSLESLARAFIKVRDEKPNQVYLHAVHRLDREAFGVVLFAKTSKALARLNKAQQNKGFSKHYLALVEGVLDEEKGCWEDFITHAHMRALIGKREGAKRAKLFFEVREIRGGNTLLSIRLETGRYHQIRAQASSRGYPIVGDKKYGAKSQTKSTGIALCHKILKLTHPVTQKELVFESAQHV